jgi:hypothetical protein
MLFDKAKMPNVEVQSTASNHDVDHVNWAVTEVQGATHVILDRRRNYRSLTDFSNAVAKVIAEDCVREGSARIQNARNADVTSNIQARIFECSSEQASSHVGIVVREIDSITVVLVMRSGHPLVFNTVLQYLVDKEIVY